MRGDYRVRTLFQTHGTVHAEVYNKLDKKKKKKKRKIHL